MKVIFKQKESGVIVEINGFEKLSRAKLLKLLRYITERIDTGIENEPLEIIIPKDEV